MALLTGLAVGVVCGVSIISAGVMMVRMRKGPEDTFEVNKCPVTEVLQVNLVDTRIRMTDLDNLEIERTVHPRQPSQFLSWEK